MKDMGIFLSLIPHSFLWGTPYLIGTVLKVTASTTTRSTTRCSGDLMGDQMAPGDQMGVQIFDMTKM